ncbi:MAG: hypothetical protein Q8S84_08480 [bacterium]|nr:hypothetical protein [bacterium]MDP3381470.1 hypothetical protein [bacterium]
MSGGWKWINIPYEEQLKIKQEQIKESLNVLKNKINPKITEENPELADINLYDDLFLPIETSPVIN